MGDSPGTGQTESTPEASQTLMSSASPHNLVPPPPSDSSKEDRQGSSSSSSSQEQPQQIPSKRASLPPRPPGGAPRHTKRLTLNFPINIPQGAAFDPSASSSPAGPMTPIARSSARQSPVHTISTPAPFDGQDDGSSLLTAIASQERKVLELREELHRAESELDSLKKQWTSSEKSKKRTEIHHRAEQLLPLKSPDRISTENLVNSSTHSREESASGASTPSIVAQARLSRELERRQTVLAAAATHGTTISANGRRVFQGSHARTLSLLSPTLGSAGSKRIGSESGLGAVDNERVGRPPRSATMPSVDRSPVPPSAMAPTEDMISQWRKTMPPPSRDLLLRTGKQMASDLKEGLWTFLEDIRQATVGDEGIYATESRTMQPPRNRDSSSTSRSRDRLSVQGRKPSRSPSSGKKSGANTTGKDSKSADIDATFWSEFGIDSPGQKSPNAHSTSKGPSRPNAPEDPSLLDVDESWDDWDTPQPKKTHTPSSSRSTIESKPDQSPTTQNSSPRTSTSFGDWGHDIFDPSVADGIPWPAITKMAPSKLARTASNLMAEWERSLSPSSERNSPLSSSAPGKDSKKD
ncbi:hypothetical protein P175DRAFT_0532545 [Aspergillus ochraceoroseus IBT 24754]|uniref:DUF4048 domain-containing protein n=2 Tax=Aspergillus ochraceoroseus TaxID=138278 RepID=A0A2T5LY32_9EURO|nr:uncharacterized protein P175DRAFT_0532545 [Aspergillus ochraceoroseus IBT 24754]KKK21568.1 hypothetical protein AOCH_003923 [Aspergillus ochraceoroseus]PTU21169.1 hypothetical protein P175DRAFT_0532545 [Aspergillus ochraceoroseus IBT 24754]